VPVVTRTGQERIDKYNLSILFKNLTFFKIYPYLKKNYPFFFFLGENKTKQKQKHMFFFLLRGGK
jgi:hypothetical protein